MGVECFSSFEDAKHFLCLFIQKNYPKGHNSNRWKQPEEIVLGYVVDPEGLFPYVYKITQTTISFNVNCNFY